MRSQKLGIKTARKRLTTARRRERQASSGVKKAERNLGKAQSYSAFCKSAKAHGNRLTPVAMPVGPRRVRAGRYSANRGCLHAPT